MKRIALLLAGAVLGSGCVIDTTDDCAAQSLTVDWRFIDENGNGNLLCSQVPGVIDSVDVYIDGTPVNPASLCTDYSVTVFGVGTGWHRISVEGYDGATFVNRDWADIYVSSCGDTYFAASPGEGWLEIAPTGCSVSNGYLLYSVVDYTRDGTGYVFDQIDSTSGIDIQTYRCNTGIYYLTTVPYGDYQLYDIEEVDAGLTTTFSSNCAGIPLLVDYNSWTSTPPDTTTYPVAMDSTLPPSCGL